MIENRVHFGRGERTCSQEEEMGYYVKHLSWKKTNPKWKVQYVSYKKEHIDQIDNSKSKNPKKTWDV